MSRHRACALLQDMGISRAAVIGGILLHSSTESASYDGYVPQVGRDGHYAQLCSIHSLWQRTSAENCRFLIFMIAGLIFLGRGIAGLKFRAAPVDLPSLVAMGFGGISPKALSGLINNGV